MMNIWYSPFVYSDPEEDEAKKVNKDAEEPPKASSGCECGAEYTCAPQFHYQWCPMHKD